MAVIRHGQYQRLERHLRAAGRPRVEMTFAEVAQVIGERLPDSAYQHPAWWGSDPGHTQSVWLDAGYTASPNLTAQKVTFTKVQRGDRRAPDITGNPVRGRATTERRLALRPPAAWMRPVATS